MVKPKWAKRLTVRQIKHIADMSSSGRATLRSMKMNIEHQRKTGGVCFECSAIAARLGI